MSSYAAYDSLTEKVLGCAYEVHTALGPGLLENTYQECLFYKHQKEGIFVEKEKGLPLVFEDVKLQCGYRVDLLIENKIVIELKSVEGLTEVHTAQVLTYLKLGGFPIGFLMNFNVKSLKQGIKRYVN